MTNYDPAAENQEHFSHFMRGFTAAVELQRRAQENGFFVECVCLTASIIDAFLRVGVILKGQIDKGTPDIPIELVLQTENDPPISERKIYKLALANQVIGQSTFDELNDLYDQRNRVIHRYVISRITTQGVLDIAIAYQNLLDSLIPNVLALEQQQVRTGVGMSKDTPPATREFLESFADAKHTPELAAKLRGS